MNHSVRFFMSAILAMIIALLVIVLSACNVDMVKTEGEPSCCVAMYKVTYLRQKQKENTMTGIEKLADCCRQQDKINFCDKFGGESLCSSSKTEDEKIKCVKDARSKRDMCIELMKTF